MGSAISLRERLAARWREADECRQRAIFAQEEIDWTVYAACGLADEVPLSRGRDERVARGQRAFERVHGHISFVRESGRRLSPSEAEVDSVTATSTAEYERVVSRRVGVIEEAPSIAALETYLYKRHWRDTEANVREANFRAEHDACQLRDWLLDRLESVCGKVARPISLARLVAAVQDDKECLVVMEVITGVASFDPHTVIAELLRDEAVPNHPFHVFTDTGLTKRSAWEDSWRLQRQEDAAQRALAIPVPPEYSQGSRGKSKDYVRDEYWRLRGKLDVPQERFIAFTEVPGRGDGETLYGWAGWTPADRVKAILVLDEECEDHGIELADRIALLDSAWRLIPDVTRDDAAVGARLKAELQALLGVDGPSKVLLDNWKQRFPPPGRGKTRKRAAPVAAESEDEVEH